MDEKFLVTEGASTGPGTVIESGAKTATLNGKPLLTVGSIATHPKGGDVVIEGMPTVLLNGQPITFAGAKTAQGGTLIANTTARIVPVNPDDPLDSYTGLKAAPRMEDTGKRKPQEVKEDLQLESTFALEQLTHFARTEGLNIFMRHIEEIFDTDIHPSATKRLYDALIEGSLKNPPILICTNRIHGRLEAAYHTKKKKIYVTERLLRRAAEDNEARHKLMVALVEEFGHYIDYLLREVYDKNRKKDSRWDEGARFAYQGMYDLYFINPAQTQKTTFAHAVIDGNSIELEWEYKEVFEALEKYTKDRQYGTNDHVGEFEGFKVEDLSKAWGGGGFGHKNIQKQAVIEVFGEDLSEDYIDILYYGNWMRDYSQLICPAAIEALTGIDRKNIQALNDEIEDYIERLDKGTYRRIYTAKTKAISAAEAARKTRTADMLREMAEKKLEEDKKAKIILEEAGKDGALFTIDSSIVFLQEMAALMAYKHFNKKAKIDRYDADGNEKRWRQILCEQIPGFYEQLGISQPWDHFDNPFGTPPLKQELQREFEGMYFCGPVQPPQDVDPQFQSTGQAWRKICDGLAPKSMKEAGIPGFPFWQVDKDTGIKNHIRTTVKKVADAQQQARVTIVYDYLCAKLEKVAVPQANKDPQNLIALGGILHILQDFYAHSNYAETYLASKWFDGVVTWTSSDRHYRDFDENDRHIPHYAFSKDRKEKLLKEIGKRITQDFKGPLKEHRHHITDKYGIPVFENLLYRKGLYTPLTTGTYDATDMMATALEMLKDTKFSIDFDEYETEKYETGKIAVNDVIILEILEFVDRNMKERDSKTSFTKTYNLLLNLRDMYAKKHEIAGKKVSAQDVVHKLKDLIGPLKHLVEEALRIAMNVWIHFLLKIMASLMVEYQLVMSEHLKSMLNGTYPTFENPSHTMLAKDDAYHPINPIAGKLAIEATKTILNEVQMAWDGNSNIEAVKKQLQELLTHPLQTDIFDDDVTRWGIDNPRKVLLACLSSYTIEGIRRSIIWADKIKRTIDKTLTNAGIDTDKYSNKAYLTIQNYVGHGLEELLNKVDIDLQAMKEQVASATAEFKGTIYFELDVKKMWDFYKLYYPYYQDRWRKFSEQDFKEIARQRMDAYCDSIGEFGAETWTQGLMFWENATWQNFWNYAGRMANRIKDYYTDTGNGLKSYEKDLNRLYGQANELRRTGFSDKEHWRRYWEMVKEDAEAVKNSVENAAPTVVFENDKWKMKGNFKQHWAEAKEKAAEAYAKVAQDFSDDLEHNIPLLQADIQRVAEKAAAKADEYAEEAKDIDVQKLAEELMDEACQKAGKDEGRIMDELKEEADRRIEQAAQQLEELWKEAKDRVEEIPGQTQEMLDTLEAEVEEAWKKAADTLIDTDMEEVERAGRAAAKKLGEAAKEGGKKVNQAWEKAKKQIEEVYNREKNKKEEEEKK